MAVVSYTSGKLFAFTYVKINATTHEPNIPPYVHQFFNYFPLGKKNGKHINGVFFLIEGWAALCMLSAACWILGAGCRTLDAT